MVILSTPSSDAIVNWLGTRLGVDERKSLAAHPPLRILHFNNLTGLAKQKVVDSIVSIQFA